MFLWHISCYLSYSLLHISARTLLKKRLLILLRLFCSINNKNKWIKGLLPTGVIQAMRLLLVKTFKTQLFYWMSVLWLACSCSLHSLWDWMNNNLLSYLILTWSPFSLVSVNDFFLEVYLVARAVDRSLLPVFQSAWVRWPLRSVWVWTGTCWV